MISLSLISYKIVLCAHNTTRSHTQGVTVKIFNSSSHLHDRLLQKQGICNTENGCIGFWQSNLVEISNVFNLDASSKSIYFSLYFTDPCPYIIPLKVESHTQLPSQLINQCYREIARHTTTIERRCTPTQHGKESQCKFYYSYRRKLVTFFSPSLVTISMY